LTNFFITILIPLNIATKNRKSIELAGAGTTIAVINLFYWLINLFATSIINAFKFHLQIDREVGELDLYLVLVVLILSVISSLAICNQSWREYKELKVILRNQCCRKRKEDV
jgi:CBS domain containing-hemolysin-like protein